MYDYDDDDGYRNAYSDDDYDDDYRNAGSAVGMVGMGAPRPVRRPGTVSHGVPVRPGPTTYYVQAPPVRPPPAALPPSPYQPPYQPPPAWPGAGYPGPQWPQQLSQQLSPAPQWPQPWPPAPQWPQQWGPWSDPSQWKRARDLRFLGQMLRIGGPLVAAVLPLPQKPPVAEGTGNPTTDMANILTAQRNDVDYKGRLADHAKLDERIRTILAAVGAYLESRS